jgi:hypothetical protein
MYFDVNEPTHLALLPAEIREWVEVRDMAAAVEFDVIEKYTDRERDTSYTASGTAWNVPDPLVIGYRERVEVADGLYVYLKGYKADATEADAAFALAMRRAVADVLAWRVRRARATPAVQSESGQGSGAASKSYTNEWHSNWPRGWQRWLRRYDTREVF